MPQFSSGELEAAKAVMTNPKPKAFDYDSTLYMGVNMVAMASKSFHLDAGQSKEIGFDVEMPMMEGTYPVYIDVSSGGVLLKHYRAIEDVVIVPGMALELGHPAVPSVKVMIVHNVEGNSFSEVGVDDDGLPCVKLPEPIVMDELRGITINVAIFYGGELGEEFYLWYEPTFAAEMPPPAFRRLGRQLYNTPIDVAVTDCFGGGYYYPGVYDGLVRARNTWGMWNLGTFRVKNLARVTGTGVVQ